MSEATDVFMLGCTFIEVFTGCSREPYDWLMEEDPSGRSLFAYRASDATLNHSPLAVRLLYLDGDSTPLHTPWQPRTARTHCVYSGVVSP